MSFGLPSLLGLAYATRYFVMRAQAVGHGPGTAVSHTFSSPATFRGEIEQELRVLDLQHFYWLAVISLCATALAAAVTEVLTNPRYHLCRYCVWHQIIVHAMRISFFIRYL